jgi:hypothetical protein
MTYELNGTLPGPPLRLTWFGASVISDWNNPIATTVRATMRALLQDGHQVVFLEPRNSPPFVEALAARGWAPYRDFQTHFADLRYRTYDMPRRSERDVWLSREAALVDAVIVQSDAPDGVFEWLDRVPDAPMLRVLLPIDGAKPPIDAFDLSLSPEQFGPAVNVAPADESADRSGTLVVVYSGSDLGALEREADRIVASGAGAPAGLDFVSEAALPDYYRDFARIVVVDDDDSPFAAARAMLAATSGAETWRLQRGTLRHIDRVTDAAVQSDALAHLIAASRAISFQNRIQPGNS